MSNEAVGAVAPVGATDRRAEIERLIEVATGRVVTVADLRAAGGALDAAGVNSIGYINLLEALEARYGVAIDPEADPQHLATVDSIAEFVGGGR
ncbi:phosphopantetheine-binding protein [Actinokineospora pegani]|uniref:phosphopantetheine-binding protein n=1 Tax=Actinokineospora pegani TaxID=2654637 RepID=UPI0012EAFE93|nr:phosphopantetheine-binding protein [Actinokineospora pegani]